MRDITDEEFPPNSQPCTDDYDYFSDSNLEDESSKEPQENDDSSSQQRPEHTQNPKTSRTIVTYNPLPSLLSDEINEAQQNGLMAIQ